MIGRGSEKERELVASLLLVMMTANEKAWRAAKSSPLVSKVFSLAASSKKKGSSASASTSGEMLQEVAKCLNFEGTHEELSDHMLEISKPK